VRSARQGPLPSSRTSLPLRHPRRPFKPFKPSRSGNVFLTFTDVFARGRANERRKRDSGQPSQSLVQAPKAAPTMLPVQSSPTHGAPFVRNQKSERGRWATWQPGCRFSGSLEMRKTCEWHCTIRRQQLRSVAFLSAGLSFVASPVESSDAVPRLRHVFPSLHEGPLAPSPISENSSATSSLRSWESQLENPTLGKPQLQAINFVLLSV